MWSLVVTHVIVTLIEVIGGFLPGFKAQFEITTWIQKKGVFLEFGSSHVTLKVFCDFRLSHDLSVGCCPSPAPCFARPGDPLIGTLHNRQLVTHVTGSRPTMFCSAVTSWNGAGHGRERANAFSCKYQSLLQNLEILLSTVSCWLHGIHWNTQEVLVGALFPLSR